MTVYDCIIRTDVTGDELLHHILRHVLYRFEKMAQFPEISNLVCSTGTNAHIRFGDDWKTYIPHKGLHSIVSLYALNLTSRGNTPFGKELLHGRLFLYGLHFVSLQTSSHMEVSSQPCILSQPILIIRLYPVYLSILESEECYGTIHLIVVLQIVHPVILRQRTFQFSRQLIIRSIGNAQYTYAIALQAVAKLPVGMGKMG